MEKVTIRYCFRLENGTIEDFPLEFEASSMTLVSPVSNNLPDWAKLDFGQCENCPLSVLENPYCPLALSIAPIVDRFDGILSYETLGLDVDTDDRRTSHQTTAQRAVSSLMGLVIATSGCPHMNYFKPMARFHLPLANEDETAYRSCSMYMMAQYFRHQKGLDSDQTLAGMQKIYRNVQTVNYATAQRLRVAATTDSSINALISLDIFAQMIPFTIEDSMNPLESLFAPFLAPEGLS
ncbi:hypothetical protein QUF70_15735 [Desulfobacterales bacterium HSG17]|nr:hypothetical protein [Desulfobacterales bacterium HSG17]